MKILIMTPSVRTPYWGYINSVEGMEAYIRANGMNGNTGVHVERIVQRQCSNLSQGRQSMLDIAISENFTHGIFIDDDMEFLPNILDVMFESISTGVKALGVNYLRKDSSKMSYTATDVDGAGMVSYGKTGIEKSLTCGLGFFIIDIEAMKKVPHPHFEVHWNPQHNGYVGEDRFFTSKLRAHGVPVYIDHTASRMVGHIGDFSYTYDSMRHENK